jgi:transposase InsO family protein
MILGNLNFVNIMYLDNRRESISLYLLTTLKVYIHFHLWGRASHSSIECCDYMITLIDDFSRKGWVYFLKHKNDALTVFKQWKALVENHTGRKIRKLRTDNRLEFCNDEFDSLCADHGIARHKTISGTPQQNGVAERRNHTISEHVHCMLSNAGLWDKHGL